MIAGPLSLVATSMFAGAALHITMSEQPARLALAGTPRLQVWKGSFTRALRMAPPLALAGFVFGVIAWWQSGVILWLLGALLTGAVIPFTLTIIQPVNQQLLGTQEAEAGTETDALIVRWGQLHDIRTWMTLMAAALMVGAIAV